MGDGSWLSSPPARVSVSRVWGPRGRKQRAFFTGRSPRGHDSVNRATSSQSGTTPKRAFTFRSPPAAGSPWRAHRRRGHRSRRSRSEHPARTPATSRVADVDLRHFGALVCLPLRGPLLDSNSLGNIPTRRPKTGVHSPGTGHHTSKTSPCPKLPCGTLAETSVSPPSKKKRGNSKKDKT